MSAAAPADAAAGAGTGGRNIDETIDGTFSVTANALNLVSRPPMPPAIPGPCVISILSTGFGMDGLVDVRGSQGIRMTAGPPPALPSDSSTTNGVEIAVSETGNLTLKRGLLGPVDQSIEMTPSGITIDAGMGSVTIQSFTEITLSVAGGLSKISITPEGVTIEAMTVKLSALVQAQIEGLMTQITGQAMTQMNAPMTMIG